MYKITLVFELINSLSLKKSDFSRGITIPMSHELIFLNVFKALIATPLGHLMCALWQL